VTFVNNVLRHAANGINILGIDDNYTSAQTRRILIAGNLFYDIGYSWNGGELLQMLDGTSGVKFTHNTALHSGNVITADGQPHLGFAFTDNIVINNRYGIIGTGTGPGNGTLAQYFPDSAVNGNVFVGGQASSYPAENYFPSNMKDVGFRNEAANDFELSASSPYKGKAADGNDPGASIQQLCAALNQANPALGPYVPTCNATH